MRSHVTNELYRAVLRFEGFNTASGMRSHVTNLFHKLFWTVSRFQYRKRYEVTCDERKISSRCAVSGFNTASGMRSHVTASRGCRRIPQAGFQYRKRYEVTCDYQGRSHEGRHQDGFQYRKRYEVTCDLAQPIAAL